MRVKELYSFKTLKMFFETHEDCLFEVQENGCNLQWVPAELKTPAMCLAAVRQNGNALCHVDTGLWLQGLDDSRYLDLLLPAALQTAPEFFSILCEESQTPELASAVLQHFGCLTAIVPAYLRADVTRSLGVSVA